MTNNSPRQLIKILLDAVFPAHCLGCGNNGELLCKECLAALPKAESGCFVCEAAIDGGLCPHCARKLGVSGLNIFWTANYKERAVHELICALKYRGGRNCAAVLGTLIFERLKNPIAADFVVPVPIHPARRRSRGFNQAELLAKNFGTCAGLPFFNDLLVKTRNTDSQVESRSRAARLKNLSGSFAARDPAAIAGKNIILIDDVLTTGATIIECAKTLRCAGARKVTALVVAH